MANTIEININLTREQIERLCEAVGADINEIKEGEILDLVDRAIDQFVCR